jgi:hypothetical protein
MWETGGQTPNGWACRSEAAAGRNGMQGSGPSNLIKIDGPQSSPSSSHAVTGANPSTARHGAGAHLGRSSGVGGARGEAVLDGESNDGRHSQFGLQDDDLRVHDDGARFGAPGGRWPRVPRSRKERD